MGAVVSCIEGVFQAIGRCLMAIVNAIGSIFQAIISGIVTVFDVIIGCLTCNRAGGRRNRVKHSARTTKFNSRHGGMRTSRI